MLFGLLLEVLVFRHLYERDHLEQVLATFGVILFLNQGVKIVWGAAPLNMPMPDILSGSVPLMEGLRYPVYRFAIIAAGLAVAVALYLFVTATRVGMLVRAGATNAPMVSALGVDIKRLFMIVFGFGAMLAGFAGAMVAPILSVEPGMGDQILILAFVVIVIGGIGSIRGAFVAALLVGVIDTLGPLLHDRRAAPVPGPQHRARDRPGARLHGDLSADGRRAGGAPGRPVPGQGTRLMRPQLRAASWTPRPRALRSLTFDQRMAAGLFALMALLPSAEPGPRRQLPAADRRARDDLRDRRHLAGAADRRRRPGLVRARGLPRHRRLRRRHRSPATASAPWPSPCRPRSSPPPCSRSLTGAIAVRTRGVYFIMITLAFGQMAFFVATSLAPYGGDDGLSWPTRTLVLGTRVLKSETAFFYVILALLVATYVLVEPPRRLALRPRAARAHRQRDAHAGDRLHALSLPAHRLRHRRHASAGLPASCSATKPSSSAPPTCTGSARAS